MRIRAVVLEETGGELAAQELELWPAMACVDPAADDETAVREASRAATRKAIGVCVEGRDPAAAAALVERRDALRNPFYGGR